MMKQPFINIRETLNNLLFHRHDELYEKKDSFVGKNLLINGDKSVSQRGDYSSPTPITTNNFYVDKNRITFTGNVLTLEHLPIDSDINSRAIKYEVVSATGGRIYNFQSVDHHEEIIGKTVTYTATVKTNSYVYLFIAVSGSETYSELIRGNGTFQTFSLTIKIKEGATSVVTGISDTKTGGALLMHVPGDYITIGNEQLEEGNKFTGYEYIAPAVNLANCRKTMLSLTSAGLYDSLDLFLPITSTTAISNLLLTPMDTDGTVALLGGTIPLNKFGPTTGTITPGSLVINTGLTDMALGKLVLSVTGTGFTPGEMFFITKNNDSRLIYLEKI